MNNIINNKKDKDINMKLMILLPVLLLSFSALASDKCLQVTSVDMYKVADAVSGQDVKYFETTERLYRDGKLD